MNGLSITAKLAAAQLRQNRKRTVFTLLGIILAAAMISAVFGFAQSGITGIGNLIRSQSDFHIAFETLTPEDAAKIAADESIESSYTENYDDGRVGLYARLNEPSGDVYTQGRDIAGKYSIPPGSYGITRNTELLAVEGYLPDVYRDTIYTMAAVLLLIIIGTSVIVVSNAFRVSAGERTMQFGMLKSVGATAKQVRQSVLYEGLFLTLIGVPVGIAAGLAGEAIVLPIANSMLSGLNTLGNIEIRFDFAISWQAILLSVAIGALTVFISALIPAYRAAKLSAIDAIRGSKDVKLKPKQVRTSKLAKKLFGCEGELAAKGIKRDRRGYRATVVSLAAGVILFLVGTTFGGALLVSSEQMYGGLDATAMASYSASESQGGDTEITIVNKEEQPGEDLTLLDPEIANKVTDRLRAYNGGTPIKMLAINENCSNDQPALLSVDGEKAFANLKNMIPLISVTLDDAFYSELCEEAGAQPGEAILINTMRYRGVYQEQTAGGVTVGVGSEWQTIQPLSPGIVGQTLNINRNFGGNLTQVPVGGVLSEMPPELKNMLEGAFALYAILPGMGGNTVAWFAMAEDAASFSEFAQSVLEEEIPTQNDGSIAVNLQTQDIMELYAAMNGLNSLVMVFVYGFIALLTLIGLTNVISTIMTNIRLRQSEFAVLMSVGMTREGLRRSLNLESMMCGIRSLIFGLPIGLILSFLLHQSLNTMIETPFALPWLPLVCCTAAVFIVTFVTMKLASSRIRKGSIVETIRSRD
jgi:putative ABC transport system permease protein